jgi:hypothetical protein
MIDRLDSVDDDVQDDLLEALQAAFDLGQVRRQVGRDTDPGPAQRGLGQPQRVLYGGVDAEGVLFGHIRLTRKVLEIGDDLGDPVGCQFHVGRSAGEVDP